MHEAGHAVAALIMGMNLNGVDINRRRLPDGRLSVGYTDCPVETKMFDEESLIPAMIYCFAGPLAESHIHERAIETTAFEGDQQEAFSLAALAVCERVDKGDGSEEVPVAEIKRNRARIDDLIKLALEKAAELVDEHIRAITEVADALTDRRSLTGDEVAAIVNAA
jgi:ATP-dependent Zn protease